MKIAQLETVVTIYLTTDYDLTSQIIDLVRVRMGLNCHLLSEANKPYAITVRTKAADAANAIDLIREAADQIN